MIHTTEYLEAKYATPDPWGYQTHPDDLERKDRILEAANQQSHFFARALDIGAGEGWITGHLPALCKYAIETSDTAASRFPEDVIRIDEPEGVYDLVLATGVLYLHYDVRLFHEWIIEYATGVILTCNLEDSEVPLPLEPIYEERFPYRGRVQHLCVYDRAIHNE